jgi:PST family polysaccharide transporter
MGILTSWWYARKIKVAQVSMTIRQFKDEVSSLLKLGIIFMASGLMGMGSGYLVRIIVLHKFNLAAAGFFQSAWNLGGLYIAFILQAMGADFYPRLTAVANDNQQCNRLVNEQTEIGLLLAGPGVLATLTFAPLVINLLYSAKFGPAVEILRWICLGMMVRAVSWPMGFILIAKAKRSLFFWSELVSNLLFVGLVWMSVPVFGVKGAGIAFFGLTAINCLGIYLIVFRVSEFRWSVANLRLGLLFTSLVAVVFSGWYVLPRMTEVVVGVSITLLTGIFSLKTLCALVPLERLPGPVRKIIIYFRLTSLIPKG